VREKKKSAHLTRQQRPSRILKTSHDWACPSKPNEFRAFGKQLEREDREVRLVQSAQHTCKKRRNLTIAAKSVSGVIHSKIGSHQSITRNAAARTRSTNGVAHRELSVNRNCISDAIGEKTEKEKLQTGIKSRALLRAAKKSKGLPGKKFRSSGDICMQRSEKVRAKKWPETPSFAQQVK